MTKNDKKQTDEQNLEDKNAQKEQKETEKLKQRVSDLENQVKRVLADYQNLQKRTLEERKDWIKTANKDLILRLLPILDTLIMAEKNVSDQGLTLSIQQFLDVLKNEGVVRIETVGRDFDPRLMECITTASNAADAEEGKVIEELRAGYTLNDTVLRPAQVKVGKT